jgi:hypothetical protein
MEEFVQFQSFTTEEETAVMAGALRENNIPFIIRKSKQPLDHTIAGESPDDTVFLLLCSSDFSRANEVLDNQVMKNLSAVESDYYLYAFTNEELTEILSRPDEWSRQDVIIARKILNERGTWLNDEEIENLKTKRMQDLESEEKEPRSAIVSGYLLAFLFSIAGIFFGLAFLTARKILPDGRKIFSYNMATRKHGRNIFVISLIMIILLIINRSSLSLFLIDLFGSLF